jgi:hypothetical protein
MGVTAGAWGAGTAGVKALKRRAAGPTRKKENAAANKLDVHDSA